MVKVRKLSMDKITSVESEMAVREIDAWNHPSLVDFLLRDQLALWSTDPTCTLNDPALGEDKLYQNRKHRLDAPINKMKACLLY